MTRVKRKPFICTEGDTTSTVGKTEEQFLQRFIAETYSVYLP